MSSDAVHAVDGLSNAERVRRLRTKSTKLRALRDQIADDLRSKEQEVEALSARQEVLAKVLELYRVLMDQMIMNQVKTIEKMVTEGLRTIFYDQDLSFKIELAPKYNRIAADIFICSGDPENGGVKGDPLGSFGGGPASIVSLILRVLTMLRLKRRKLLLLDETLNAVSNDYIETTAKFLRELSETTSLPILMVTHKSEFMDHATIAYQGEKTESSFSVKRVRGASA